MINPQRKKLFTAVSYLIWAAWFYRWISVDMGQDWLENRWIIVPMVLYGLLLGLDSWLTSGRPWRVLLYLAFQAGLVFLMAIQAVDLDYFYLLLLPLVGQAIFLLPRRQAYIVVGAMMMMNICGLIIINGWPEAISFIVLYNAAIIFTLGYSILMLEADEARRETQRLLTELQEYAEQARQLAIVEERNRLARELHDSVTQALYGLTLQSEAMARQLESDQGNLAPEEMRELRDIAQQALQEMRLMIFELRPTILKESGLAAALQARLETVENRSGMRASLEDTLNERLPLELESGLYGIAREALNNIVKHAQARQIDISLAPGQEDSVIIEIADDGVGFDPENAAANGGLGFEGMQERAEKMDAILTVDSRPAEGTRIRVEVKR
jgi:signal transduction histidine kinase